MKTISRLIIPFLLFQSLAAFAGISQSFFTVLEKSSDSILLEWDGAEVTWQNIALNGRDYVTPGMGRLPLTSEPGTPRLPVDAFVVQASGRLSVVVLDSVYEEISVGRLLPAPTQRAGEDRVELLYLENKVYQSKTFLPASFLQKEAALFQQHPFTRLAINPVRYNPSTGRAQVLRYMRILITVKADSDISPRGDGRLLRPSGIPRLGNRSVGSVANLHQSTAGLTLPGPRLKIKLVESGVYRLRGEDIQAAGMSLALLDPQKIRIENRGVEQACLVLGSEDGRFDVDDAVLFYGERLSGEDDYYHAYSDTNVYWLSSGESDGLRITPTTAGEASESVFSFTEKLHFEQDREYYQGDTNSAIQETETVPGEGWVWDRAIDQGGSLSINFDLPGYEIDQDSVTLQFRVRGITRDSEPDAHWLRVSVNGQLVHEQFFDDREEIRPQLRIAGQVLQDSANVLHIESVRQGDRKSRFYFDWFEVTYQRRLQAQDGQLHVPAGTGADARIYWAGGFPTPDVHIWNLTDLLSIEPDSISKNWTADLRVASAGILDGNFAQFYLQNDLLYSGSRGISVVVLDPHSGEVIAKKSFDTFASPQQSDSLVLFLNQQPAGALILAGVRDDGANNLTEQARQAFRALGSTEISNLQYRQSWAFIAQKGSGLLAEQRTTGGDGAASAATSFTFKDAAAGHSVQFVANSKQELIIFDAAAAKPPLKIEYKESNPLTQIVGADYVIITHRRFTGEVQRLADYRRQHNGFQTAVIDVDDVFDAYSDGIFDPTAIRKLMQHASGAWMPGPSFLLLFGDASWDMKQHYPTSQFSNFVPSLGNPVSDALFVCLDGEDDYLPDISVGRIPATTVEDARSMVDKIIEYESLSSSAWKKNFLFISGGFDEAEQGLFYSQSQALATDFVDVAPTFGHPIFISKDNEENSADERSLILDRLNAGVLWVNFIGHAASRTWELMFNNPDIEDLTNQGRYPFISSMTCHTGRFAEPAQESFGERFLLIPEKGAIGFWGTSGWGYSYEDYLYLRSLYPTVLADTVRYLGDIITLTKLHLWEKYGFTTHFKNLILQYNLMGDPALMLTLPTKPDLTLAEEDIRVSPAVPSEADSSAMIHVRVQNWGLAALDSISIQLDIENTSSHLVQQTELILPPVARLDSSSYHWPLQDMAGVVEISATVDPHGRIEEWDETNNTRSALVTVLTSHLELVSPPQNSVVPVDQAVLKVQAPQQYFDENAQFIFEVDTSRTFNSQALLKSDQIRAHPLVIKWQPRNLSPGQRYYWRIYNAAEEPDSLFVAAFYTSHSDTFGWRQSSADAGVKNSYAGTSWSFQGVELDTHHIPILLQSAWTNSIGYAVIEVENQSALQTGRGYNFAVLDQHNGRVLQTEHFDTYGDAQAAARLVAFLDGIPAGRWVLGAISDEGYTHMTEDAYQAIESIGSTRIRQVQYRSMWAIIGKKGAAPGSVPEGLSPFQTEGAVVLKDTLALLYKTGTVISERIGPATRWQSAAVNVTTPDSASLEFNIYGQRSAAGDTVLLALHIGGSDIDLSSIDAGEFPFLSLAARLSTLNGRATPIMHSWQVLYESAPDIALSPQLFTQSADTVMVGQEVTFYLDLYNIGMAAARDVELVFEAGHQVDGRRQWADIKVDSIDADRFVPVRQIWQSGAIPGLKKIYITADPEHKAAELSEANNSISTTVFVHADTLAPSIELTFDERTIFDGDIVSPTPLIVARVFDNNPTPLTDTTSVNFYLDGQRMSFSQPELLSLHPSEESGVRGIMLFRPTLEDGTHELIVEIDDASHNSATTNITFVVESDLVIRNALNYPNPFAGETEFRFSLSQKADIQIKVYTVAGRLIRTIDSGAFPVGYCKVYWDGLDSAGDALANGVYLYKIKANSENESVDFIGKVIVMR